MELLYPRSLTWREHWLMQVCPFLDLPRWLIALFSTLENCLKWIKNVSLIFTFWELKYFFGYVFDDHDWTDSKCFLNFCFSNSTRTKSKRSLRFVVRSRLLYFFTLTLNEIEAYDVHIIYLERILFSVQNCYGSHSKF